MAYNRNDQFIQTVSGAIDIRQGGSANFTLVRTSDGSYLETAGSLTAAQNRAAAIVTAGLPQLNDYTPPFG